MLSASRIINPGQTPHAHEREAFDVVVRELPDTDPYQLWAFVDLVDPGGRRYDIDLLVVGYHAVYLIEVKSHSGTLTGDEVDWQFTFPDGGRQLAENPLRTTTHKARVLASLLEKQFARDPASRGLKAPWVQPLVFLANPKLTVKLKSGAANHVVTQQEIRRAITHGEFPGVPPWLAERTINRPTSRETKRAFDRIGLRPSVASKKVGSLVLRELLEDGAHFQDHLGDHEALGKKRRVRSYLVPPGTTAERRDQILRAARREAQHLAALSDHRNVLRFVDYVVEGPLGGPCVVLEHFEGALPLDAFLRNNPNLSFDHRIEIVQQLGEALEFCHRKQIVHRALNPRAILVRRSSSGQPGQPDSPPEIRLYNFQLAAHEDTSGTVHLIAMSPDQAAVYIAPEVLQDPAVADARSDVFSLGAIAYHVLTGRPPGTSLTERAVLLAAGHLSVAAARDDLGGGATRRRPGFLPEAKGDVDEEGLRLRSLDEIVGLATEANPHGRADSAIEWLNLFLDAGTTTPKEPDEPFAHPLDARPGDRLSDELTVIDVLGSGSTARVLRVRRDDTDYALKIALSPDLDDRVRNEGQVLKALQRTHDRIDRVVSLVDELTLGERACLLMTHAGESLAVLLGREGPPSLDFARRWGEDLLRALEALEEKGIQHRDIKPANLGVLLGEAKKKRNLLLFDFSLAGIPDTAITAGTPVYRDPFLERRGKWDAAADRWAAAMTLHELVTGVRPGWGQGNEPAAASEGAIQIAAERFDAQVRSKLVAFFRQALAREVTDRFGSVEAMRVEWVACFASASYSDTVEAAPPASRREALEQYNAETPIAALPLSNRAKNALDRAGMTVLSELVEMPSNRLSTTRGIGHTTHREILAFVEDVRAVLGPTLAVRAGGAGFFPGYPGPNLAVSQVSGLPADAAAVLEDAGLGTLATVAAAPSSQVTRLLGRFVGAEKALKGRLAAGGGEGQGPPDAPTTVEAWIAQLFEKGPTFVRTAAQLFGLEPLPGGAAQDGPLTVRSLGNALRKTGAAVHASLVKARGRWQEHPQIADLQSAVVAALEGLGGVGSLARVAEALLARVPHQTGVVPERRDVTAEALVRVAAEIADEVAVGRVRGEIWIARAPEAFAVARRLGAEADELAARTPLPSTEEVQIALAAVVDGTILTGLAHDRLVGLAAEASEDAARSARLELYPRGMSAARALALSAGALAPAQATPEAIRRLVRARYPDAASPPEGDDLHALMHGIGLVWQPERGFYERPGAVPEMSLMTAVSPRQRTTHTTHRPARATKATQEDLEFNDKIRIAVEKRQFRVLDVTSGYDARAADELIGRVRANRISIEGRVLAEADRLTKEWSIDPAVVLDADRRGPAAGDDWENLRLLLKGAAERALGAAIAPGSTTPVVLIHPGILARYALEDVLGRLVERAQSDDAPAVFLVNPTDDAAAPAVIDGGTRPPLPVPLTSPAQRLRVPIAWALNAAKGGAT